ncbi:MAG: N-acetylneuraminate synthase family protein [Patescibacteria group bacterium]
MRKERKNFFKSLAKHLTYETVKEVKIGSRFIGENHPVFIIAEVSANHRGKINNALRAIEFAAEVGADAIKFQHLTHDKIAADTFVYDNNEDKPVGTMSSLYKTAELPYEWTDTLVAHAKKNNITFLSTPFDNGAVDLLDKAGVPAFKIASYELTDDIFLRYVAKKGKPIIVSTGMAYLEEVAHAVRIIQEEGNNQIIILHCISIYPPKSFKDLNLRAIKTLQESFQLPVGYSDHSTPPYLSAPITAVALGACIIEKHLTDNRDGGSNDDRNSLTFGEFKRMIEEIRHTEQSLLKRGIKQPVVYPKHSGDEIADRWARRSLYAAKDIPAGAIITEKAITTLRPFGGIDPKDFQIIKGRKTQRAINARSPITFDDFFT